MEILDFQGKKWEVKAKVDGLLSISVPKKEPEKPKKNYDADMVIRNPRNIYFVLNEIIDVEYEEI